VSTNVDVEDGHGIGLTAVGLPLSPEWRKYALVFTANRVVPGHGRLTFILGDAVGTVDLAGTALQAGKPGSPAGPNLLPNGDFSHDSDGWTTQSSPAPASATFSWVAPKSMPAGLPGKIAHVEVTQPGSANWHVQLYRTGIDLREAEPYTLTFWARADADRPIGVAGALDVPDWHGLGMDYRLPLTPEWRKYSLSFTPTQTVKGHTRMAFVLGDTTGAVELAGVSLRHEPIPSPAPARAAHPLIGAWESHSADAAKIYRFVFNADGTGSLQLGAPMTPPGSAPRAPVAHAFRWYVAKQADQVVLAGRPYRWTVSSAGGSEQLVLKSSAGKTYILRRAAAP
jgi:hypothetical protein